jgi:hypothetical protein
MRFSIPKVHTAIMLSECGFFWYACVIHTGDMHKKAQKVWKRGYSPDVVSMHASCSLNEGLRLRAARLFARTWRSCAFLRTSFWKVAVCLTIPKSMINSYCHMGDSLGQEVKMRCRVLGCMRRPYSVHCTRPYHSG